MTKTTKTAIITTLIIITMLCTLVLLGATAKQDNTDNTQYILRAEVINVSNIDTQCQEVECVDTEGNAWCFYSEAIGEYYTGDYVLLLMDTCTTQTIYDDEVIAVRFDSFAY